MIADLGTVMWKELKEVLTLSGGRTKWGLLVFVGLFGVFMPLQMGREWVESPVALAYWSWIPLLLVNSTIADAFAGERERRTLETLLASRLSDRAILFGKIFAAMAYACGIAWVSVLTGLVTVNVTQGHGELLMYSPGLALGIVGLGILASGLGSGAGVLVSLRASTVRQAQLTLSRISIALIFIPIFGVQAMPSAWKMHLVRMAADIDLAHAVLLAVIVLVAGNVAFFAAAMARFRRARLILD